MYERHLKPGWGSHQFWNADIWVASRSWSSHRRRSRTSTSSTTSDRSGRLLVKESLHFDLHRNNINRQKVTTNKKKLQIRTTKTETIQRSQVDKINKKYNRLRSIQRQIIKRKKNNNYEAAKQQFKFSTEPEETIVKNKYTSHSIFRKR